MTQSNFIPYGKHWIDEDDIKAVATILSSSHIARGPTAEQFEQSLKDITTAPFAVAVSSGTAGLHLACLAAGIKAGDEVITSPITFVASANCVLYCGAKPIFADIDIETYNINPKEIEKKINERTKAIIPVHFAGQSCDMETIVEIVRKAENKFGHKIWIIEDACHVLDSQYKGKQVGACEYGDMSIMSFHPVKHITSGEGGVVFARDSEIDKRLRLLRGHGITRDPNLLTQPWHQEQIDLGYNYFITDIQCALAISQLEKLLIFKKRRQEIVKKYNEAFAGLSYFTIPYQAPDCDSTFHLYVPLIDFEALGVGRIEFMEKLKEKGIGTQLHYVPVYAQPYYQKYLGTGSEGFLKAEQYYKQALTLPLYPKMSDEDIERIISAVKQIIL